jgi:hypothetical protein
MDKQPYINRLLEAENLTDALEDSDANPLLQWGVQRLNDLLEDVDDRKTAGERVTALMAVMRKINQVAGSYTQKDPPALAEDLRALWQLFSDAFGHIPIAADPDLDTLTAQLRQVPTRQVIDFLTQWYFQPGISQIPPSPG